MYVHIGEDTLVRSESIIAIISRETVASSPELNVFLQKNSEHMVDLSKGNFKSIVVTQEGVYFSSLSSSTLKKRTSKLGVLDSLT